MRARDSSRVRRPAAGRRLECPVCLGAALAPFQPSAKSRLVVDYCRRCGGVWFDAGEVPALKTLQPESLLVAVALRPDSFRMKCHDCHASFDRNRPTCTACGWENRLTCPVCRAKLQTVEHDGLRLDACASCRGVWFDNVELAAIWNGKLAALTARTGRVPAPSADSDNFLLHAVLWSDPFTAGYVVVAGADAVGHLAGAAAPLAGAAIESTGELAGSVFAAIGDLIASIFDGLG